MDLPSPRIARPTVGATLDEAALDALLLHIEVYGALLLDGPRPAAAGHRAA